MSDEQGFLETLAANPADDVTRLVYADWLDERGDPRDRYLRLEVELAGFAPADPRLASLEAELKQLRPGLSSEWCELAGKRWDVWLLAYHPARKITVIRAICELTSLGLLAAHGLSDALPARVVADPWRGEAEEHCARLREAASRPYAPAPPAPPAPPAVRPASPFTLPPALFSYLPGPAPEECVVLRAANSPAVSSPGGSASRDVSR
jgi:uncharacterized protein (TIGR02996 family)